MVTESSYLTIALPKGKLFGPSMDLLKAAGIKGDSLEDDSRKLLFVDDTQKVRYIICRPTDIPTFVEYGAADLGIVGKDTIVEQDKDVCELLDLKFGGCRFVVAVPEHLKESRIWEQPLQARVATKFSKVATNHFQSKGLQVEVIKLHGNIELAPIVGLAEMIVDIVSTGRTLRENNLVAVEDIFHSTSRLIANRVSYRLKFERIRPLVEEMRQIIKEGRGPRD